MLRNIWWLALLAGCSSTLVVDRPWVDLSHPLDETGVFWPTGRGFELTRTAWGLNESGRWYASCDLQTSEHGGTHIDAPIHFAEGRWTTAEIPLEHLVGPARVIDAREACARVRDYRVSADDVRAHEREHGRLRAGEIVLIHTGWSRFWPDRVRYLGSAEQGSAKHLHFPGLGEDAARLLVERGIHAVGIDTASMDHGPSTEFRAHRVLAEANVVGIENLNGLERLPARGAMLMALPLKITGGTGGPCRVVAVLEE